MVPWSRLAVGLFLRVLGGQIMVRWNQLEINMIAAVIGVYYVNFSHTLDTRCPVKSNMIEMR